MRLSRLLVTAIVLGLAVFVVSLAVFRSPTQVGAAAVTAGHDLFETDGGASDLNFGSTEVPAIPADFFGPGSDPFTGSVAVQGVPTDTFGTFTGLSPTDTIVERKQDAGPPGFPDTIDIEIVALSLRSVGPITVTYNGGQNPEPWDLDIDLPPVGGQNLGSMTVRHEFAEGGTFDSTLPVKPLLTFTRQSDALQAVRDYNLEALSPIQYQATGVPWCHSANPLTSPPGHQVIEKAGLTTNFFPSITCQPDAAVRVKQFYTTQAGVGGTDAQHTLRSAELAVPLSPHYECFDIAGQGPPLGVPVDLETQFGTELDVIVDTPAFLCPPALKYFPPGEPVPEGDLTEPHLKCYNIVSQEDPPHIVNLETQFGVESDVEVGPAQLLCAPASKSVVFPFPEPGDPLVPSPHYKCYQIIDPVGPGVVVDLETQFGLELGIPVENAQLLCAPALKWFPPGEPVPEGDLTEPHLKCYSIFSQEDPPHIVDLETQFGLEIGIEVGVAQRLCVPVTKTVVNIDTFEVRKQFDDSSTASVTVSLSCTSGSDSPATLSPAGSGTPNTPGAPVVFTVSGFSGDPTCTATESPIPAGYSSSGTCAALLSVGTCTIVNTLILPPPPVVFSVADVGIKGGPPGIGDITPVVNVGGLSCASADLLWPTGTGPGPCAARIGGGPPFPVPDAITFGPTDLGLDTPIGFTPFFDDLNAVSWGEFVNTGPVDYDFSVDAAPANGGSTVGSPGCGPAPNVGTEVLAGLGPEAQGDIFNTGSAAPAGCNLQIADESVLGLIAPNAAAPLAPPLDELDALTVMSGPPPGACTLMGGAMGPVVCSAFSLTPTLIGDSIMAGGVRADAFSGGLADYGSILVPPGAPASATEIPCPLLGGLPCSYVHSTSLGLVPGLVGGDDIDALCWFDANGNGVPDQPNSFNPLPGLGDYYIFSLTPASASVTGGPLFSAADLLTPDPNALGGPPIVLRTPISLGLLPGDNVDALICRDDDTDFDGAPDLLDNCPAIANATQLNTDGDQWGDACETADCLAVPTLWVAPPGDQDCDGWTTTVENFIGTDPLDACGPPADVWPVDMDNNQVVTIADVGFYVTILNAVGPNPPNPLYLVRFDLNMDVKITIADVGFFVSQLNMPCP